MRLALENFWSEENFCWVFVWGVKFWGYRDLSTHFQTLLFVYPVVSVFTSSHSYTYYLITNSDVIKNDRTRSTKFIYSALICTADTPSPQWAQRYNSRKKTKRYIDAGVSARISRFWTPISVCSLLADRSCDRYACLRLIFRVIVLLATDLLTHLVGSDCIVGERDRQSGCTAKVEMQWNGYNFSLNL